MKRFLAALLLCLLLPLVGAATLEEPDALNETLGELVSLPGVSGYEQPVSKWLAERLKQFHPQVDNLGNVIVTLAPPSAGQGSGAPHRLLVTPIDEPGYVVSAITPDGYLRVERLPQAAPHPWFDLLHSTQPVQILTRRGTPVPGVVAGLSTHLQPGRESSAENRTDRLDRLYIDVGAGSPAETRALGVDLLDPITLEKHAYELGSHELTAPFLSDRVGAAALVRLVEGIDAREFKGTLTVAFVVRRYMGNQGLDRLLRTVQADEIIFVQRLEKSDAQPGAGVLLASLEGAGTTLAADLVALAQQNQIPAQAAPAEPAPRGRYTGALPLPARTAVVGVPVRFPQTPAEIASTDDTTQLLELLALYLGVTIGKAPQATANAGSGYGRGGGSEERDPGVILKKLVEVYGVSGREEPVAEQVRSLLPAWAQEWATVDGAGNLFMAFGKKSEKPSLVFVAHMDEIGWAVKEIREDGRLVLERKGGFLEEHFLGHMVLIHTAKGPMAAVLELPEDYRTKKYERVQGRADIAYTGAHTKGEVEKLGIQVGDTVTVPKQYRQLAGTRISARSFDDRVGATALIAALWEIDPATVDREVIFVWSVQEEVGLEGAKYFAAREAEAGGALTRPAVGPDYVFAVDTFVSSDSPLESPRFAGAQLGEGFVVRAVDNSNVVPRPLMDRVVEIARRNNIPVQYGVTGGGNDGAAFVPYGAVDVALGWPLRYSHSPGEVADLKDVEALGRIVAALVREF